MADVHLNKCKDCTRNDTKINRKEKEEYYKEYDRNRPNHEDRIKNNRKRQKELKESDQETFSTKQKVNVTTTEVITPISTKHTAVLIMQ